MKVLLATCMTMPHSGGASTHFDLLARSLERAGMLAGRVVGQHALPSRVRKILCSLQGYGCRDAIRAGLLRETAKLLANAIDTSLASSPADAVHCHDPLSAYAAMHARAMQERGLAVIETVHGPWSREIMASGITSISLQYSEARRIEERAHARCTHFIAVDQGQADILSDDFAVARERISVVHNAVDCDGIRALGRKCPRTPLPEPYFLVPRRLVPKNGVHVALEALEQLARENICLAIAGDGPLSASLRAQAERAGISRRVHFLGSLSREELMPLVAASAGVIVPSVPCEGVIEATSLSVIEAFACGVPVIASNIGGLAELIEDGRTGFLFAPGDANALARAGIGLLRMSPGERNRLCAAARAAALARWDVSPWFTRISEVYEQALCAVSR